MKGLLHIFLSIQNEQSVDKTSDNKIADMEEVVDQRLKEYKIHL